MDTTTALLGLGSALLAAVASLWAKRLLGSIPARSFVGPSFLIIGSLLVPALPFLFAFRATPETVGLFVLVVAVDSAANLAYFVAVSRAHLSRLAPVASLSGVWSALFAPLFFPRDLTLPVVVASGAVVASVLTLQLSDRGAGGERGAWRREARLVGLALVSGLLFGLSANLSKILLGGADPVTNPATFYCLRALGIGAVLALALRPELRPIRANLAALSVRSLFVIGQWLLFLTALGAGNVVVATTFGNATPVFIALAAPVVLGEPWRRRSLLAAAGVALGVIVLARL